MAKLRQIEVDRGCQSARERYASMEALEAMLSFAYELQGYVADSVERGSSLDEALASIDRLMVVLRKAQKT